MYIYSGKKIGLTPMTPENILRDDLARASRAKSQEKQKSENQIVASEVMPHKSSTKSGPKVANEIRLKHPSLLATKSDISELDVNTSVCYAIVCKEVFFLLRICLPLCHLLLLTFCRSLWTFFTRHANGAATH